MATNLRALAVSDAAWREAARAGDDAVDIGDVFLALLATGGEADRVLGTHGINLDGARRAARRIARIDAGRPEDEAATAPIHIDALGYDAVGELPWTTRASEVAPTPAARNTDFELLLALLDDESDLVRRIVDAGGADPAALREQVASAARESSAPDVLAGDDPGELLPPDAVAATLTIGHHVAQPVEAVWASVTDPRAVVTWAGAPETSRVVAGAVETTVDRRGQTGHVRLAPVLVEEPSPAGARIVWQERHHSDKVDGEPGGYYDLRLRPDADGTALTLVRGIRATGAFARALLPIARRTAASGLPDVAQNIAYESARRR